MRKHGRPQVVTQDLLEQMIQCFRKGWSTRRVAKQFAVSQKTAWRASAFCVEKETESKLLKVTDILDALRVAIPPKISHLLLMGPEQLEYVVYGAVLAGSETVKSIAAATGIPERKVRRVLQKGVAEKMIRVGKRKLVLNKQGLEERGEEYVYSTI